MHTTHVLAPTPARRTTIFTRTRSLLRIALAASFMLCFTTVANAQWTDSNTGVTFTPVSGSTTGSEGYDKGCDGNTGTKHGGQPGNLPHYLVVQASQEVLLTGYTITTANDNASYTGRSPYTWKIQGSNTNNGSDWVDIASVTNDNVIQNVNYTEYTFSCSTSKYYTYFRFYITAINGGNYMQYSEFHPIGEVRLDPGTSGGGGSTGPTSVGYVITNGSVYLGGTSTNAIDTFNPQTCLWTGTSGGTWRNSAGYYLRYNYALTLNASNTSDWTLSGTENGNTGQKINQKNQNNRYIRYNNGWTVSNSTNATNAVFAVTKTTYNASYTVPAIGGATVVSSLGSNNINTIATAAAYTQKYYNYIFRNNTNHYVDDDDETYLGSTNNDKPSASTFTYTWSLDGISTDYATINETTGVISYNSSVSSDVVATVTLTASSTKKTFVVTKDVTFKVVPPTSITPSTSNITVYVGNTGTVTYSLSPTGAYHNVSVSSGSNSIATAVGNNAGTVTITPVSVGNTTVTLSAARPGTTALTAEVNVAVKNKVTEPVIQFDQIGEGATATASISCPTNGATIYYTHTRGGQTIASGTYSSSFTVNEYDQVEAYASMVGNDLWDNSETITETYVSCTTQDPIISYTPSGSTATVTITAESGATIYYTTNGDNPKISSNQTGTTSVTINNVNGGTTIKAYAKNGNCSASEVVSKEIITTGANASVVTLYDYEDHSWSYYSDGTLPQQLQSLNPADVKITYYGNGTNNVNVTTNSTTPGNNDWTLSATSVQVSTSETANTFIYYKTLERTDGSTSNNPTGRCAYTAIPNPFSKRPSFTSGGTKYYTGFYKWRVVSVKGGSIYAGETGGSALATANTVRTDNVMLDADQTYYFAPDSEYGMEVEFEAMWARAYTTTNNNTLSTYVTGTNAYERNFNIITSAQTASNIQKSYPLTISSIYPDGTNGGGSVSGGFTAAAITKFENIRITGASSATWSANGKGLIIGRGCSGTIANLYGATSAPTSSFSLRIESGSFTSSYILYFSRSTQVSSGITMNATYGCDYDRANNETNTNLTFSNVVEVGYYAYCSSADAKINMTVLSGTYGSDADNKEFYLGFENAGTNSKALRTLKVYGGNFLGGIAGGTETTGNANSTTTVSMRVRGGTIHRYLYGAGQYSETSGARRIVITGGTFDGWIAGGAYGTKTSGGKTSGDIYLYFGGNANQTSSQGIYGAGYGSGNYTNNQEYYTVQKSNVVVGDDAQVAGNVYGGGNNGFALDDIKVFITGATVAGDVYGGANKAPSSKAVNVTVKGGSVAGGVYGGSNQSGAISGQITVDVYGTDPQPSNGYSIGQVFGGGNVAAYSKTPNVTIYCGDNISIGEVYGGGNNATVSGTNVTVSGGNRIGYVYGGGRQAAVNGNTSVKIYGGTIEHAFAGNNISGNISGTLSIQVDRGDDDCLLKIGELYGGGNQAASKAGSITIGCTGVLTEGHSNLSPTNRIGYELEGIGDVYGGANNANITSGNITLNIQSGMIARVFGGNNVDGSISGNISVSINKNSSTCGWYVGDVFGAGNLAQYTIPNNGSLAVSILNGTVSGNVYGGGKGLASDHTKGQVTGNPVVTIGDANKLNDNNVQAIVSGDVYGGGDAGNVVGTPQVNVIKKCNTTIANVYGGGNAADVNGTDVNIDGGNITGMVFGGGHGDKNSSPQKEANVNGDVAVDVTGGTINKVFGGSNSKGSISGSVTVNINKGASSCDMHITEVYGGGNEAAGNAGTITIGCTGDYDANQEGITTVYGGANAANVGNSINLTIKGGHIDNVYGGNNASGNISGSVTVNVNWDDALTCGKYLGNVFGGGNLAALSGSATVNIQKGTVSQNVYGGGNQAGVGTATVSMTGGSVLGGLYGGCNTSGTVDGAISVSLTGGTIGTSANRADVFGGGLGSSTTTSGNIGVTLNGTTVYGDLYGGSALGQVNGSTSHTTTLTISSNTLHGTIYGGGKGSNEGSGTTATSNGNVLINYNTANTSLTGLYGGANVNGLVKGNITVNVIANVGASGTGNSINVFGGGLGHATNTEGNVTVNVGTASVKNSPIVYGDIYGGSALGNVNDATTDQTTVNILNGTVHGNVYGGGLGDATLLSNGYLDPNASTIDAIVNGTVHVNIGDASNTNSTPTIDGKVFGCNNLAGTPKGNVYVDVYRTAHTQANTYPSEPANASAIPDNPAATAFAISEVYGGGNLAHYTTNLDGASTHVHIHNCDNTIRYVYGGGNAANTPANEVTIDGGRMEYVFGGGNGAGTGNPGANVQGNATVNLGGGIINYVFGGSNTLGVVNGTASVDFVSVTCTRMIKELYGGGNMAPGGTVNMTIPCGATGLNVVFGGSRNADIGSQELFNGGTKKNVTLTIEGGNYSQVFGGNNQGGTIWGDVTLNLVGGTIVDAFGGNNAGGNVKGIITVNVEDAESSTCPLVLTNVFGGGKDAPYTPADATISSPLVNIKHKKSGTSITGNVFGGGQGPTATVTANPIVTIGDLTTGHESYVATISGDVYGGGDAAAVIGTPVVHVINKSSTSIGNVYGGGNAANVSATSVTIDGGTITGDVYGGGHGDKASLNVGNETGHSDKVANVNGNVSVTVTGGTINRVFGGSNTNGNISGTVTVNVNKGANSGDLHITELYGGGNLAAGNAGTISIGCTGGANEGIGDVYGGANQADIGSSSQASNIALSITGGKIGRVFGGNNTSGTIYGTIQVNVEWATGNDACGVNSLGSVFGGGNQAAYSAPTGSTNYPVVNIKNGTITNNVFGGGLGASATVTGNPQVTIGDATEGYAAVITGDVYGGGDAASVSGTPMVRVINKSNTSIGNVYGGGNAADVSATSVTIDGGTITGDVFGGGHGDKALLGEGHQDKTANVGGNVSVSITGGTIHRVFGGSNTNGNISGTVAVNVNKGDTSGEMHIDELYGGGNVAAGNAGNITIGCTGGATEGIGDVYGGANAADVNNGIALTISGGHINRVFGGNNTSGSISGSIQVNVNWNANSTCGDNYIGNVYGGGNQAPYTYNGNYPKVNIINGTIAHNVYGGGLGAGATVTANPQVVLTGGTITGKVFGGGEAAPVTGNPTVTASGANVTATRLYGGGLGSSAVVTGNTTVTVSGGTYGYVFGGGEEASQTGNVVVNIQGGTITNDVYGGGALAHTNTAGSKTTTVNLTGGTMKNVYGGGLGDATTEALVYGNVAVNLNQGIGETQKGAVITDYIFGCNNINGTPKGSVTVHVYSTQNSSKGSILIKDQNSYDMKGVYGGGNLAAYIPSTPATATHVIIDGCGLTSIEYVYGGGNAAPVPATVVDIFGSYKLGSVFGGGNGKDQITINGVTTDNPGADVGIYEVSQSTYNNTAANLRYDDPGNEKPENKYYILYGNTENSIIGTTHVTFYGGHIGDLFGGSNTKGDIIKEAKVTLGDENLNTCDFDVEDVYGGSNEAYMSGTSSIQMNCVDGMGEIYGGSRMADVHNDIVLTINGGHYRRVFGGNNLSGRIYGSITVNIEQTGCLPIRIDELYGGGNNAPYSVYGYKNTTTTTQIDGVNYTHYNLETTGNNPKDGPTINIISCESIGQVFGGGLGESAKVVGNPTININMVKGWTNGHYLGKDDENGDLDQNDPHYEYVGAKKNFANIGEIGTVFGGGNQAVVEGETYVNIGTENTVTVHNISKDVYNAIKNGRDDITNPGFTDGDDDDATKDLTITVNGVNITGNVYGGGNNADVTGGTHVTVGKGQQGGGGVSPAPQRSAEPAQANQPEQSQQPEQPQQPQSNAATESQQNHSINATRL